MFEQLRKAEDFQLVVDQSRDDIFAPSFGGCVKVIEDSGHVFELSPIRDLYSALARQRDLQTYLLRDKLQLARELLLDERRPLLTISLY